MKCTQLKQAWRNEVHINSDVLSVKHSGKHKVIVKVIPYPYLGAIYALPYIPK